MRVILKAEVFASQHIKHLDITALIKFGLDERHLIQVEPLDADEVRDWLDKQSDDVREEYELAFDSGYRLDSDEYGQFSPFTIQVACVDKAQWYQEEPLLPLDIALKFLSQPFIIFVENRRNDSAFLRATATGWRKQKLEKFLNEDWLKFEAGGGITEVLEWVKEISNKPAQYLRGFALFDSDALEPDKPSKQSENVVTACGKSVYFHRLRRRAIENYLPLSTLSAWMGINVHKKVNGILRRKLVDAFAKLSSEQRHHFNMKKGFKGDLKKTKADDEKETEQEHRLVSHFYQNVSTEIRIVLTQGFGNNIAELFKEEQFLIKEKWLHDDKSLILEFEPMLKRLLSLV
jgi:hypothetical protein